MLQCLKGFALTLEPVDLGLVHAQHLNVCVPEGGGTHGNMITFQHVAPSTQHSLPYKHTRLHGLQVVASPAASQGQPLKALYCFLF